MKPGILIFVMALFLSALSPPETLPANGESITCDMPMAETRAVANAWLILSSRNLG